jgi:hypothetical protein
MPCPSCGLVVTADRTRCPYCDAMVDFAVPATQGLYQHVRTYNLRGLGIAAMVLTGAAAVATAVVGFVDPDVVGDQSGDAILAFFGTSVLSVLGLTIAAFVVEVIWLFRARRNVDAFPDASPRWNVGWTIGAWFVPIASVVLPALVIADVVRNSVRPARVRPVLTMLWIMVATNIIGACGGSIVSASQDLSANAVNGAVSVDAPDAGTWVFAIASLVSAAMEIAVIYILTEEQTARIAAGMAVPPVAPPSWQLPYAPYPPMPQQTNPPLRYPAPPVGSPVPPAGPPVPLAGPPVPPTDA